MPTPTLIVAATSAAWLSLWTSPVHPPSLAAMPTTWAGHQISLGSREVPLQGEVETRTDTFSIGHLRAVDGHWVLEQRACRVRFKPVGGVKVSLDVEHLPVAELHLAQRSPGELMGRSIVAWSNEDVDEDGHDGLTVRVRAPVCSGELYVANQSFTDATATLSATSLRGHADVRVVQRILGTRGACLSLVASGTDERQSGPLAFVPVDDDATCESLFATGWPVDASTP